MSEESGKTFDPKPHMIKLKGHDYLPVAARVLWLKTEKPGWAILTEPVQIVIEGNGGKNYAIFRATITDETGRTIATATKMEDQQGFPDWVEKCETGSVGRAIALCGYGTLWATEIIEGDRVVDSQQQDRQRPASGQQRHSPETATGVKASYVPTPAHIRLKKAFADKGVDDLNHGQETAVINALLQRDYKDRTIPSEEGFTKAEKIVRAMSNADFNSFVDNHLEAAGLFG